MMRRAGIIALIILVALIAGAAVAFVRLDVPVEALRRVYATAASRFLTIDGLQVHYRDQGRPGKPVLVMLHGASSSLQTWEGWVAVLKDDFRLISLDLAGHGLTGPWPAPAAQGAPPNYSTASDVRFLERFVDALNLQRFALAGNSMGGQIAWSYAARHPAQVSDLILIDSAGYLQPGERQLPFRLARLPVIGDLMRYVTPYAVIERSVRDVYADPRKVTDALVRRYYELTLRAGNREAMLERLRHDERADTAALKTLRMPVLIMWGGQDRWIAPADGFHFQQDIPDSELKIYTNAGHVPMEEQPLETATDARAFLLKR